MSEEINAAKRRLEISRGIKDGAAGVDRNYEDKQFQGVIRGFAVMTKGNVKDYRAWQIDDKTIDQVVSSGKKHSKLGLKSRFGHPNMSSTALGTFLGRAKNFYRDGDIARADLYISKTAYETPDGDLASYVLDLAERDPDAFGTSVVLGDFELEDQFDEKGKKKKDADGNTIRALRVLSLMAVDAVDDPAANNSMFGSFFNSSVELSAKATEFLDNLLSNPDALEFVIAFLERYRSNRVDVIDRDPPPEDPKKSNENNKSEVLHMEFKDITLEQLTKERPDLVASLRKEGKEEGLKEGSANERARVLTIVKANHGEFKGMGMEGITEDAIEKGHTLDATLASMRKKRLDDLEAQKNPAPGPDGDKEKKPKSHLEQAQEYQKEHGGTLTAALQATAQKRQK